MEKKRVYQILDGELLYQEDKWTDANIEHGIPDDEKPVSEWVNFMEYHMNKAKEAIYHLDTTEALAQVRKVTALGIRTMMTNGCPEREGFTEPETGKIFLVDVGYIAPEEIEGYVKNLASKFRENGNIKECDCGSCDDIECDCGDTQHSCNCKD